MKIAEPKFVLKYVYYLYYRIRHYLLFKKVYNIHRQNELTFFLNNFLVLRLK